jgi:dihydrofolate reductase
MRKLSLLAHISLDGYVSNVKGGLDWFQPGEENLAFVCKLTETADAAMFGRISYQLINSFWPQAKDLPNASPATLTYSNWYNSAQKIIVSSTLKNEEGIIISQNLGAEIKRLKASEAKDILIFGSPSITHELYEEQLIDDYWIFVNPIIFGDGIPLFKPSAIKTELRLVSTHQFSNGELAQHYMPS